MNINNIGGAANINMGVVSRPVAGQDDGDSDHDNGRRVHGQHDSFRSDFRSLMQAVQSGDMTSAQSALAAIKTDVASAGTTYSPSSVAPAPSTQSTDSTTADSTSGTATSAATASSTVGSDLKALFDAVGSGDATSAQAALATFVSDRQAMWQSAKSDASSAQGQQQSAARVGGHHGHRHHGLESVIASLFSTPSAAPESTEPSSTTMTLSDSTEAAATTAA
jgi:hypothetical protein